MIEFSGIEFRHVDNRVMSLKLVQLGLSGAAMFGPSGEVLQPSEVLRKRPMLVERGSFRPVTKVNIDMINSAHARFAAEPEVEGRPGRRADGNHHAESAGGRQDRLERFSGPRRCAGCRRQDRSDFRLFRILPAGRLSDAIYVAAHRRDDGRRQPSGPFKEEYYAGLEGGILEAFGKLFTKDLRIYVYPLRDTATGQLSTVENIEMPGDCKTCTVIWWSAAGSSSSTISTKACCTSSRATSCGESKITTPLGNKWCRPKSPR